MNPAIYLFIVPILDYGSVIWGHTDHLQLSIIQKSAMHDVFSRL